MQNPERCHFPFTDVGRMMPKQPLIIIIWTHQEMMAWMRRKSIGILDVLMGDFGSKLGKLGRFCFTMPQFQIQHSMTSMGQMMPNQPLIIIICICKSNVTGSF
jgi:hypothetical protein